MNNYLDLTIKFDGNGSFTSTIYCKQNDFNFSVIRYTFPTGNMPQDIGHNVFFGQALRFAELCSEKNDFINLIKKLFRTLNERGYLGRPLQKKFLKMLTQNPNFLSKFGFSDLCQMMYSTNGKDTDNDYEITVGFSGAGF